jgi:methionyl aminopeptidase
MMIIKTDEEVELIRKSSMLVSATLAEVAKNIKIGGNGLKLDRLAEEFIRDHGAIPAFKGLYGCPSTLLISRNEAVVHGLPVAKEFIEGDILSIDTGAVLNGYYGDSAYTFCLGEINDKVKKLVEVTYKSLYLGIEKAIQGNRVGDISYAIQHYCEVEHKYACVRELVGHGLGKSLHEDPQVPNYGKRGTGPKLQKNLTIAIEPMINMGKRGVFTADDKWTVMTQDRLPSVHFEHTVCVGIDQAEILTSFEPIEKEIKMNKDVVQIN